MTSVTETLPAVKITPTASLYSLRTLQQIASHLLLDHPGAACNCGKRYVKNGDTAVSVGNNFTRLVQPVRCPVCGATDTFRSLL